MPNGMELSNSMEQTEELPSRLPVFILLVLVSLPSVANMWLSPALKSIAADFNISSSHSSLVLSVFMLGYALSQLIYGPMANTLGRKRTLQSGIFLGIAGVLLSTCSQTFAVMLIGRFVMACGMGAGLTVIFTMVGDVYAHQKSKKGMQIFALCFAAIVVIPGIGTLISSQLLVHFGWRLDMVMLCGYTLFAFLLVFFMPETLSEQKRVSLHIKQISHDYLRVIRQKELYLFILVWGLANFVLYTLYTSLPLIITIQLNHSPSLFGIVYMCLSVGLLGSNLANSVLSKYLAVKWLFAIGIGLVMVGSLGLFWVSFYDAPKVWQLFIASLCLCLGLPVLTSTGSACTIHQSVDKSVGSSFSSCIAILCAFLGSAIFGVLQEPLLIKEVVLAIASSACFVVLLFFIFRRAASFEVDHN